MQYLDNHMIDEKIKNDICKVASLGEQQHGNDGVVMYNIERGTITWTQLHNIYPDQLRDTLSEFLTDDHAQNVFVLQVDEKAAHIWKIGRDEVMRRMLESNA